MPLLKLRPRKDLVETLLVRTACKTQCSISIWTLRNEQTVQIQVRLLLVGAVSSGSTLVIPIASSGRITAFLNETSLIRTIMIVI